MKETGLTIVACAAMSALLLLVGLIYAPTFTHAILESIPGKVLLLFLILAVLVDIGLSAYLAYISPSPRRAMFMLAMALLPATTTIIASSTIARSGAELNFDENSKNILWPKFSVSFHADEKQIPDYTAVFIFGFLLAFYLMLCFMICCVNEHGFQIRANPQRSTRS